MRTFDEQIENLKKFINEYPNSCNEHKKAFDLYKKALICLIDKSETLKKNICITTFDKEMIRVFGTVHPKMYVKQHNPLSLEGYLSLKGFVGRFEFETFSFGKGCRLYWSADNKPLVCPYELVPFIA